MSRKITIALSLLIITLVSPLTPLSFFAPVASVAVSWASPQRFTSTAEVSQQPQVLQALDGNVWVFWTVPDPGNVYPHIHYEIYNWTSWSSDRVIVSSGGTNQDIAPAVAQAKNGTIFLAFSSNRAGSNFNIYMKTYSLGTGWSSEVRLTNVPDDEFVSSLVPANDASLWLFWDRRYVASPPCSGTSFCTWIYSKVYRAGTGWSPETAVATNMVQNMQPSAFQMKDGRIWLSYSRAVDAQLTTIHIYYNIYNGASWLGETQLTSSTNVDRHPSILQDTNGSIWVFWERRLPIATCSPTTPCFQADIFYITSTNNGVSWSPEGQVTNDGNNPFDDTHPSAAELKDHRIWVFWSSSRDPQGYLNIYYSYSNPVPAHDVAVTSLVVAPIYVRPGTPVSMNATVQNVGNYTETFVTDLSASNATIAYTGGQTVTLAPGASMRVRFAWNTVGINPGKYTVNCTIPGILGQPLNFQSHNTILAKVHVVAPGDLFMTGKVDLVDASIIAFAFGSRGPDPNWNAAADFDGDGYVGIGDAALVANAFGTRPGDPNWNPVVDIDHDGYVGIGDAATVAYAYGTYGPSPNWNPIADLLGHNRVDIGDAALVAYWYGFVC